jgi:hypothetical protein
MSKNHFEFKFKFARIITLKVHPVQWPPAQNNFFSKLRGVSGMAGIELR